MNDAVWTAEATEKAVALWIEGRDPAEIAGVIGTTVADVIGRVAQAALARQQAQAAEKAAATEVKAAAIPAAPARVETVARVEPVRAEPVQTVARTEPAKAEPVKAAPRILPSRILTADTAPVSTQVVTKAAPAKPAVAKPAAAVAKPAAAVAKPAAAVAKAVEKPVAKPVVAPPAPRVEAPVMSARALEEATRAFLAANTAPSRKAAPAAKAAPAPAAPRVQAPPRPVEAPARPVAPVVQAAPEAASAPVMAAPVTVETAEGGSIVALPMSRRVPAAAADGGDGVLFLKAGLLDCTFPLWADGDGTAIESKRVCGCRVLTGKRWCRTHYATVFEPPKRPMRAA
ncbi:hypothetical protein [Methylobacterium tarhaniae]|uniref:hypothetical protein n=1 Tax=Methylobacterium tarhaniae TaxID=1187852 RepID=UPI003CFC1F3A